MDVHTHRQRAADRVKAGRSQDPILPPEVPQLPWHKQLFQWEPLTMANGRTIEKGWVVPQSLGVALVLVIIGGAGTLYWRNSDKQAEATRETQSLREMIIRMDQRLLDTNERDANEQRKVKETNEIQDLKIQDVKDKLLVINTKLGMGK